MTDKKLRSNSYEYLRSKYGITRCLEEAKTDEDYLEILNSTAHIPLEVLKLVEKDAPKRPKIYEEIIRIVFRHLPRRDFNNRDE